MYGLITDRTIQNVSRRDTLSQKGWAGMTDKEKSEWSGHLLEADGVNLLPFGPYYSSSVDVNHGVTEIETTAKIAGSYLFSVLIIGSAADFAGKTLTLSLDSIIKSAGNPRIALYWHDDNGGSDYAGAYINNKGRVTVDTASYPNSNNRAYLAAYVYATYDTPVSAGATAYFRGAMLEIGTTKHEYVCYSEIAPTAATKGAYNYSDLNRVERAVAEFSRKHGDNLTTKTDWTMWDIPKAADMERFLSNIKSIRDTIRSSITLPDTMNGLTYTNANNIEKILTYALLWSGSGGSGICQHIDENDDGVCDICDTPFTDGDESTDDGGDYGYEYDEEEDVEIWGYIDVDDSKYEQFDYEDTGMSSQIWNVDFPYLRFARRAFSAAGGYVSVPDDNTILIEMEKPILSVTIRFRFTIDDAFVSKYIGVTRTDESTVEVSYQIIDGALLLYYPGTYENPQDMKIMLGYDGIITIKSLIIETLV